MQIGPLTINAPKASFVHVPFWHMVRQCMPALACCKYAAGIKAQVIGRAPSDGLPTLCLMRCCDCLCVGQIPTIAVILFRLVYS